MGDKMWDRFNVKNENKTAAFEDLCLHLFCREFNLPAHNIESNFNQTGLEIEPIQHSDDKYYGFQAKYVESNNSSFYDQAYKSIQKAIEFYKNSLDVIYIYTNRDIQGVLSYDEIKKGKEKSEKIRTSREKLFFLKDTSNVEIKYFTTTNFKVALYENKNTDLCQQYFSLKNYTQQIQTPKDFIQSYNKNSTVAPLDNEFILREKELQEIKTLFTRKNVVLLYGASGVGKTKLALEYASRDSVDVLCISNKYMDLQEDLMELVKKDKEYMIIIDDANLLSDLKMIVQYIVENTKSKALITVRDYVQESVKKDIGNLLKYEEYEVQLFSDDDIAVLMDSIGIKNECFIEQISRIACGNTRLAILAGNYAIDKGTLGSIVDATQFYDAYYGGNMKELKIFTDSGLVSTLSILAIYDKIHLAELSNIIEILELHKITRESFENGCHRLHSVEIVDIYYDEIVKISDQAMRNYILKFCLCDQKIIEISDFIILLFKSNSSVVVYIIDTIINIFGNQDIRDYLYIQVASAWLYFEKKEKDTYLKFVKTFYRFNITKSLAIMKKLVEEDTDMSHCEVNTDVCKNYVVINDIVVNILCEIGTTDLYEPAIELMIRYYIKRPDYYIDFYHAINKCLIINEHSIENNYTKQIVFFSFLEKYADNWSNNNITKLYLSLVHNFLALDHQHGKVRKKDKIIISTISIILDDDYIIFRKIVWQYLVEIASVGIYKKQLFSVLTEYRLTSNQYDSLDEVFRLDYQYLFKLIDTGFMHTDIEKYILFSQLDTSCERYNFVKKGDTVGRVDEAKYELYQLATFKYIEFAMHTPDLSQFQVEQVRRIDDFLQDCNLDKIKKFINVVKEIEGLADYTNTTTSNIKILWEKIVSTKYYVDAILYCFDMNMSYEVLPDNVVKMLLSFESKNKVFCILQKLDINLKYKLLWDYFCVLDETEIEEEDVQHLYLYLEDRQDCQVNKSAFRNFFELKKYNIVDREAFIHCIKIVYEKREYSPWIVKIYFSCLFDKIEQTIQLLSNELDLLKDIYLYAMINNKNLDYNSYAFKQLYKKFPKIADTLVLFLIDRFQKNDINEYKRLVQCLWFTEDKYINQYIDFIMQEKKNEFLVYHTISLFLNCGDKSRMDEWVTQYINKEASNMENLLYIINIVVNDSDIENARKYILLFLDSNNNISDFRKIDMGILPVICDRDIISHCEKLVKLCGSLDESLTGIDYIEHKDVIVEWKNRLQECIVDQEKFKVFHGL